MPVSISEKTFLGDETARTMLVSLWNVIMTNETLVEVGLINGLSDLVSKWDQVPAADQAVSESMPEASLDNQLYLTSEFVSQIFDFKAASMESRGVGLQENSTPWEASTSTSVSESNVVVRSVGSDHG